MAIWSYKTVSILPVFAITLTGCLSTKPYQPPKNAATATLTYDINPASFYSPARFVDKGYLERVDIQLVPSPLSVALAVNSSPKTIYMNLAERGVISEINTFEANKKLRFSYQHKMVKGLGDWPILCVATVEATLIPNGNYILKANTTTENFRSKTNFLGEKVEAEDTSCQIQIIDTKTNKVIAEENTKVFEKMIPFYNRF
ncbi:hypothetical protein [uncultured Psychrobacter sp.]|uniref:hypothetical protein n=1 Tax=uncultured Psychrobacter sp. TaxID=259303 RepID=UPI00345A2135